MLLNTRQIPNRQWKYSNNQKGWVDKEKVSSNTKTKTTANAEFSLPSLKEKEDTVTVAFTTQIIEAVADVTTPVTKKNDTMTAAISNDIAEAIAVMTTLVAKSPAEQQGIQSASTMSTETNDSNDSGTTGSTKSVTSDFIKEILFEEHHNEAVPILDIRIDCSEPKIQGLLAKYHGRFDLNQRPKGKRWVRTDRLENKFLCLELLLTHAFFLNTTVSS